jgi:hypothetical protein
MKPRRWGALAALCVTAVAAHASDRTGVYARIQKVVMEPDDRTPQRIQIWGVFSIADSRNADDYLPAQRGYLYFNLPADATLALREWADLKAVAGTSQIVAFGSRWESRPRLRGLTDVPQTPDLYPLNVGVVKVTGRADYAPVRALIAFEP